MKISQIEKQIIFFLTLPNLFTLPEKNFSISEMYHFCVHFFVQNAPLSQKSSHKQFIYEQLNNHFTKTIMNLPIQLFLISTLTCSAFSMNVLLFASVHSGSQRLFFNRLIEVLDNKLGHEVFVIATRDHPNLKTKLNMPKPEKYVTFSVFRKFQWAVLWHGYGFRCNNVRNHILTKYDRRTDEWTLEKRAGKLPTSVSRYCSR